MDTLFLGLPEVNGPLGFWGNVASIAGLLGVLLNTWRLFKVGKIIEEDRFRIAETMKPFDLYFNLQKAVCSLRQQQNDLYTSTEEKEHAGALLKSLGEVAVCLHRYFREIHKIRNIRNNAYVDAGHLFLVKGQPEDAKDYYEKALTEADAQNNRKDISECLQGLKICSALLEENEIFDGIDGLADKFEVIIHPREGGFLTWIRRKGNKIAIRLQMRMRRYRFRNGAQADPGRLIVQIRKHLAQYEIGNNGSSKNQTEAGSLHSAGDETKPLAQRATQEPRI